MHRPLILASLHGRAESLKALLEAGASLHEKRTSSLSIQPSEIYLSEASPLLSAIEGNSVKALTYLIDAGCSKDQKTKTGKTLLHIACEQKKSDCLAYFIGLGMDMNAQDSLGRTPLMFALKEGDKQCFDVLLKHGADLDIPNQNGISALCYALVFYRYPQALEMINAGCKVNAIEGFPKEDDCIPLFLAVKTNAMEMLDALYSAGADVHVRDSDRFNLIMYAISNSTKTVECLTHMKDWNLALEREEGYDGLSPIEMAHQFKKPQAAALLEAMIMERMTALPLSSGEGAVKRKTSKSL